MIIKIVKLYAEEMKAGNLQGLGEKKLEGTTTLVGGVCLMLLVLI